MLAPRPALRAIVHESVGLLARDGGRTERCGAIASGLCAVHCAVCAVLPAAFGVLGLGFLLSQRVEWAFTLVAVTFAAGTLLLGRRRHRPAIVVVLLVLGIGGLLASRGLEMGAAPHEHAGEEHHAQAGHGEHPADGAEGSHRSDLGHVAGTGVGVMAGLFLLTGHLLDLRSVRHGQRESLPAESS